MADDKLHIRLNIYDTPISVNVNRADEEYYRQAAKLITDTMNTYNNVFKQSKSQKEITYMSMIDIALKYVMQTSRNDTAPFNDILEKLTKEIEEAL